MVGDEPIRDLERRIQLLEIQIASDEGGRVERDKRIEDLIKDLRTRHDEDNALRAAENKETRDKVHRVGWLVIASVITAFLMRAFGYDEGLP